jgi:hypothetical protein
MRRIQLARFPDSSRVTEAHETMPTQRHATCFGPKSVIPADGVKQESVNDRHGPTHAVHLVSTMRVAVVGVPHVTKLKD